MIVQNFTSGDTQTTQARRQGPDGEELIIGIVKKQMARGELDGVNRARFGLRAQKGAVIVCIAKPACSKSVACSVVRMPRTDGRLDRRRRARFR